MQMEFASNYITIDNPNYLPAQTTNLGERIHLRCEATATTDDGALGNLELHDLYLPQASVRTMKGRFNHNALFYNTQGVGNDLIGSCLFFDGNVKTLLKGEHHGATMKRGEQSIKFDPYNDYTHWTRKDTAFDIVHLSITREFFFEMLPADERWAHELRNKIDRNQRILGEQAPAISQAQYRALQQLLDCPIEGKLAVMMMEASLVQIMALQLYAQFQDQRPSFGQFSVRDKDLVHAVKDYLCQTFLEAHTLAALARQFATNTNKLMTLFRKAFGVSIFDYLQELKMDYAKRLLHEEGWYVNEVARVVGYKNPHHFATAFKRRHGTIPSSFKNQCGAGD